MKTKFILLSALLLLFWKSNAQTTFGTQKVINNTVAGASSVYADDIDGDGDIDILSASVDDIVAWYENTDGLGTFGSKQIITDTADGACCVRTADLDGDGDLDVLSASYNDDKIAWYENTNGLGSFGTRQIISNTANGATSVFTADLDGDGDLDVISTSALDNKIAWYENTDSTATFGSEQIVTTSADGVRSVFAADLDGDKDLDLISASMTDDKIAWYKNTDGLGIFSSQQVISNSVNGASSVFATDLDADGDMDIIAASLEGDLIVWYKNTDGAGNFVIQSYISVSADAVSSVYATDLDGDNDLDVLSASRNDDKIAWYENTDGLGTFGTQNIITNTANGAYSVYATDIDGDNDLDVVAADFNDNIIAWYKNYSLEILQHPADAEICPNTTAFFTVTAKDNNTFQWQEDNGFGFVDLIDNSIYTGTNTDSLSILNAPNTMNGYLYRCILANSAGNLTTVVCTLTIKDTNVPVVNMVTLPEIIDECEVTSLTVPTATDNCAGTITGTHNVTLPITTQGTTVVTWTYNDGNGNTTVQTQNIVINDVTNPTITCIANQNASADNTHSYTVLGTEFDPIATDDNCGVASVTNNFNNNSTLASAQLPEGTTTIIWTVADNMGNTNTCSFDILVDTFVGINDVSANGNSIYPNPTSGKLIVNREKLIVNSIEITDIAGKTILSFSNYQINQISNYEIDLSDYSNGMYLIKILTDKEVFTTKIIKM
jgi:hypothetical protein